MARSPTNTSFLNVCGVMNTILMCERFHTSWRSSCLVVPVSSTSADCAALPAQRLAMLLSGLLHQIFNIGSSVTFSTPLVHAHRAAALLLGQLYERGGQVGHLGYAHEAVAGVDLLRN